MTAIRTQLWVLFFFFSVFGLQAQSDSLSIVEINDTVQENEKLAKNYIKINLMAFLSKSVCLQYERVFTKFLSVTAAVRYMPKTTVPFKEYFYRRFNIDDEDAKESIDNMLISGYSFTPEVRFYLGKIGWGKGFYLAPSFRLSSSTVENLEYGYLDENDLDQTINMSGTIRSNMGGLMIGVQWPIGKHLTIDWWILGPFLGRQITDLSGRSTQLLTEETQEILREELQDIEIPYTDVNVTVDETGASVQLRGLVPAITTGLAFGVRF